MKRKSTIKIIATAGTIATGASSTITTGYHVDDFYKTLDVEKQ